MGTKNQSEQVDSFDKAEANEPVFTLLARDPLAPVLVRLWADLLEAQAIPPKSPVPIDTVGKYRHAVTAPLLHEIEDRDERRCKMARQRADEMERWRLAREWQEDNG